MVLAALGLRAVVNPRRFVAWQHSVWMLLCALTKPPNVAFVLVGWLHGRRAAAWRIGVPVLIALPAVMSTVLWTYYSAADTASWRMVEITGRDPLHFDPRANLLYAIGNPLQFLSAVAVTSSGDNLYEIWRQTIGVLGLFDINLQYWAYPTLSALLLLTFFVRLPLAGQLRLPVAVIAGVTVLSYVAVVYLICYLAFTPQGADMVWGVQGRYFVPILPLVAVMVAAAFHRAPPPIVTALLAIGAAVIAGAVSIEALLAAEWLVT
jgi:hypothetical protein